MNRCVWLLLAALLGTGGSAFAAAPAGRFKVDSAAGTVLDTSTKLTWQRTLDLGAKKSWQGAQDACVSLTLAGTGWRLPTIQELRTLVDYQQGAPALDPTAFPQAIKGWLWSSSTMKESTQNAWIVDFTQGDSYGEPKSSKDGLWRCVR